MGQKFMSLAQTKCSLTVTFIRKWCYAAKCKNMAKHEQTGITYSYTKPKRQIVNFIVEKWISLCCAIQSISSVTFLKQLEYAVKSVYIS